MLLVLGCKILESLDYLMVLFFEVPLISEFISKYDFLRIAEHEDVWISILITLFFTLYNKFRILKSNYMLQWVKKCI